MFYLVGVLCADGTDAVLCLVGMLCADGSIFFFKHPLMVLMLCSIRYGSCVMVVAHFTFETFPHGTDAVFCLVGVLCAGGSTRSF